MANYPSPTVLPQLLGTEVRGQDGKELLRSASGKPRIRTYFSSVKREISVVHELSQGQWDTLSDFYIANASIPFVFQYALDLTNYTCYFISYPQRVPKGAGYSDVTVQMVEA